LVAQLRVYDVSNIDQSKGYASIYICNGKNACHYQVFYNGKPVDDVVLAIPHLGLVVIQERDYRTGELISANSVKYRIDGLKFTQSEDRITDSLYCNITVSVSVVELYGTVTIERVEKEGAN
jgi:hypothetical protein